MPFEIGEQIVKGTSYSRLAGVHHSRRRRAKLLTIRVIIKNSFSDKENELYTVVINFWWSYCCFRYTCNTRSFSVEIHYKERYMFKLHREIWRIIDYKDFYDKAPQRTVSSMLTSLFAVGRIPPYFSRVPRGTLAPISSVRERWRRTPALFCAGEKERKRQEIYSERWEKRKYFVWFSLSIFFSKK